MYLHEHAEIMSFLALMFNDQHFLYFRCSSGNTESFKEKHSSVRVKRNPLVTLPGIPTDDKSSSESLNFGKFIFSLKIVKRPLLNGIYN